MSRKRELGLTGAERRFLERAIALIDSAIRETPRSSEIRAVFTKVSVTLRGGLTRGDGGGLYATTLGDASRQGLVDPEMRQGLIVSKLLDAALLLGVDADRR